MAGGLLRWGVKESFVDYVTALDDGVVEWGGGAGPGRFPVRASTVAPPAVAGRVELDGWVRMHGYRGVLEVELSELAIDLDAAVPVLSSGSAGDLVELPDIVVRPAGEGWEYSCPAPLLTRNGYHVFGGNYRPGTPFAPLSLEVPAASSS